MSNFTIVQDVELKQFPSTREFIGEDFATGVCFILVEMPPGDGVRLHRHAYDEIFIVQEGSATYRVGEQTLEVEAPQTLIVRAGVAHAFTNTGSAQLKQVDIHLSPRFITEWLE